MKPQSPLFLVARLLLAMTISFLTSSPLFAQSKRVYLPEHKQLLIKLRDSVEANMQSIKAHENLIREWGLDSSLISQYKIWMRRYPKIATIPSAIGLALAGQERPEAREFLLKAVELNPKLAEDWFQLFAVSWMTDEKDQARNFIQKAMKLDSLNSDYAFSYAYSFRETDTARYQQLALAIIKKFPNSEVASKSLYWLANDEQDVSKKIAYYEELKNGYLQWKSYWRKSALADYYRFAFFNDPQKALEIARIEKIPKDIVLADTMIKVRELLSKGNAGAANALIKPVFVHRYLFDEPFILFKAKVADSAHDTRTALDTVEHYYSKRPSIKLRKAMEQYALKLGLTLRNADDDVKKIRDSFATEATDFSLGNYTTVDSVSLKNFKDKIILLTYWFPGCGPCRAEMPHFENVLKNFDRKDIVYLGLNLEPSQDSFVQPLLKSSGFSFIALRDSWKRNKGNLKAPGAPTNYLIDGNGRIVFSNFMVDENNEDMLKLMLGEMLDDVKKENKAANNIN